MAIMKHAIMRTPLLLLCVLFPSPHVALPDGDPSCPCLPFEDLNSTFSGPDDIIGDLDPNLDLSTYGVGCAPHDQASSACLSSDACANIVPLPVNCDRTWCRRSWCYVDADNCDLANRASFVLRGKRYSYATCGFMDSFAYTERLTSLKGRTLQVALNSNSGGWKGAYNPEGSFAINQFWRGPIVKFFGEAALEGGFNINITRPPEWLREKSREFFGSSSFDYCVYATSLGYLDMCIAAYTVSDKRAATTPFFETSDDPIYLITFKDGGKTTWGSFNQTLGTIFQPFTLGAWLLMFLFCFPVLSAIMLLHEYGAPGSAFPRSEPVVTVKNGASEGEFSRRKVPIGKHAAKTAYMAFLSFFQETFDQCVVTWGGKFNMLAVQSLTLLAIAVYTANLAAILTTEIVKTPIANLDEAIAAGYNFCSERKVAEIVMDLYNVDPNLVVPDPEEIGGDGRPGFNCPDCAARSRVFEYMRPTHNDKSTYCNAAFASLEDMEIFHKFGDHCDKTNVGDVLAYQNIGIPLYSGVSDALNAFFLQLKNDGKMQQELKFAKPENKCPSTEGEGNPLNIEQMTGVWMLTWTFATAGLIVKAYQFLASKRRKTASSDTQSYPLQHYDQWCNPTQHAVLINGKIYDPDGNQTCDAADSPQELVDGMVDNFGDEFVVDRGSMRRFQSRRGMDFEAGPHY